MLKELIRAIYEIAKAIKGDDGNNGGGGNTNDNGLYGADGICLLNGHNNEGSKVFLSQKELIDDFKENVDQYDNSSYGNSVKYLYTENNIDKLLKPTEGVIGTYTHDNKQYRFATYFLNEYSLSSYELISIQDWFEQGHITESDVQKIVERLGNNVYVFEQSS